MTTNPALEPCPEGRERDPRKPVKVTVSDPETGEVFESKVIENNYVVVTAGNRYVKNIQIMGRTHMLAIAVESPGAKP